MQCPVCSFNHTKLPWVAMPFFCTDLSVCGDGPPMSHLWQSVIVFLTFNACLWTYGVDNGNWTHIFALARQRSAIELHPHINKAFSCALLPAWTRTTLAFCFQGKHRDWPTHTTCADGTPNWNWTNIKPACKVCFSKLNYWSMKLPLNIYRVSRYFTSDVLQSLSAPWVPLITIGKADGNKYGIILFFRLYFRKRYLISAICLSHLSMCALSCLLTDKNGNNGASSRIRTCIIWSLNSACLAKDCIMLAFCAAYRAAYGSFCGGFSQFSALTSLVLISIAGNAALTRGYVSAFDTPTLTVYDICVLLTRAAASCLVSTLISLGLSRYP